MTRQIDNRSLGQISLRGFQFIFAIISAGLIGAGLADWTATNTTADSRWIYVEVVVAISAFSCIAQWWLALNRAVSTVWDSLCFLLWMVAAIVLGQAVLGNEGMDRDYSTSRNRAAVGVAVLNMLLWLASAVESCICCGARQHKKPEMSQLDPQDSGFEAHKLAAYKLEPPAYEETPKIGNQPRGDVAV